MVKRETGPSKLTQKVKSQLLRSIPSLDRVLRDERLRDIIEKNPRQRTISAIQSYHQLLREHVSSGSIDRDIEETTYYDGLRDHLEALLRPRLRRVINATGIIVHTNLGRSIFSASVAGSVSTVLCGYSNLEYDLNEGRRSSRYEHLVPLLRDLTGYEDSLIVNNNAAALLIALDTFAFGTEVIISRGELVEIGGGFRIPEVIKKAGVDLVEVGCTNKTSLADYAAAVTERTSMIIKVHRSNFAMSGFTAEVGLSELVELSNRHGLLIMHDLGSGNLLPSQFATRFQEPTISESFRAGVHILSFSGDKLLGGPQAGIILTDHDKATQLKKNQLLRALRVDKMCIAALEATLECYLDTPEKLAARIPTIGMLLETSQSIRRRCQSVVRRIRRKIGSTITLKIVAGESQLGGGSLPHQNLPTWLLAVRGPDRSATEAERLLRMRNPPIIAMVRDDQLMFDLRTVQPSEHIELAHAIADVITSQQPN